LNKRKDVVYVPGGSTQNTIRVAAVCLCCVFKIKNNLQWVWGRRNIGAFMGCIGKDKYGDILEKKAREAGVNVRYQRNETTKTGTCAVLIYQHHRFACYKFSI
jgi:adenosine kinase